MIEFIFVDLLTLPFNIFVFLVKYLGSLLFWVALVTYTWSFKGELWDWVVDKFYALRNRLRKSKGQDDSLNDIDDYII